jgi:uncharacterized protein (TIGR02757 family)
MGSAQVKDLLEHYAALYEKPDFIEQDPISIPHLFSQQQDIEVAGFFAAIFSWGQRKTIINKTRELIRLMDDCPYDFIRNHQAKDRRRFEKFVHRTFQYTDTLYFLTYLQQYFRSQDSLEHLFCRQPEMSDNLSGFCESFFSLPQAPHRTRKHIATPVRNSTCKRLNMYLRWMVRSNEKGVDFGIWKQLKPKQLMIPLDVHVDRVARKLGLLSRKQTDWLSTVQLTESLRRFDPQDPVKYDFALFSLGVLERDIPL